MVVTIICVVLVIAWIVWWIIQDEIEFAVGGGICFGIITCLVSVLFCTLGCGVSDTEYNFDNNEAEYSIIALQDNTFIYRKSGEHLTYVYAYKEQDGKKQAKFKLTMRRYFTPKRNRKSSSKAALSISGIIGCTHFRLKITI